MSVNLNFNYEEDTTFRKFTKIEEFLYINIKAKFLIKVKDYSPR